MQHLKKNKLNLHAFDYRVAEFDVRKKHAAKMRALGLASGRRDSKWIALARVVVRVTAEAANAVAALAASASAATAMAALRTLHRILRLTLQLTSKEYLLGGC